MSRRRKGYWLAIFTALLLTVVWGCKNSEEQARGTPEPAGSASQADENEVGQGEANSREDAAGSADQAGGRQSDEDESDSEATGGSGGQAGEASQTPSVPMVDIDQGIPVPATVHREAASAAQSQPQVSSDGSGGARSGYAGPRHLALDGRGQSEGFAENDLFFDAAEPGEGQGPGQGGNQYDYLPENPFVPVAASPRSTFSIDVDTASYSNTRMYLTQYGRLPPPQAVRIEEFINYFSYDYEDPAGEHPFSTAVEVATCPWQPAHRLVRVGLQGEHIDFERRAQANLVFLLDVSGSMDDPHKLPLVKDAIRLLVGELNGDDRVAIVVYAGEAGLVLDSTELVNGQEVLAALDQLSAGGSTDGGEGIQLAYKVARDNFVPDGINRIILCTDGDFNVGQTDTGGLVETAVAQAKGGIFLSVLGFGMGNYNDAMLESISNNANGNCAFIDSRHEARKVMVEQVAGTLITIAKDVKIQVEFNPAQVYAYRLIGYENRMLRTEDFTDDTKDAGEIGAGHQVTALYEVVPVGAEDTVDIAEPEDSRYQAVEPVEDGEHSDELLTVNLRYKLPDEDISIPLLVPVVDNGQAFGEASDDFRFAASVAAFGMLLRDSQHAGNTNYEELLASIRNSRGEDTHGYRSEFLQLVGMAEALTADVPPADDAPESGWDVILPGEEDAVAEPTAEEAPVASE